MKTWIWIAVVLLVVGLILFVVTMSLNGWNFKKLSALQMNDVTHTVTEPFTGIRIETTTADIRILPSEDGECKVVCHEYEKVTFTVQAENGKLTVLENDKREWYDHIGFYFGSPKINVYLPEK